MKTILVVDDEADIVESLEVTLSRKGHRILKAFDGEAAFKLACDEKPDLVIMDVMMPPPDGFEICKRMKANETTKSTPVLLLTALSDTANKVKGLEAGADDFITKPFIDAELHARVGAFLRTKELRDELARNYSKLKEMEELRQSLTHMIVHDLKSPLASIDGNVGAVLGEMKEKSPPKEIHQKLLSNAKSSTKRLLNLIQDILDVSRLEEDRLPIHKTPCDAKEIALGVMKLMEPVAQKEEVALKTDLDPDLPTVSIDRDLMERVLMNLVSNSVKFTSSGGSVTLSVREIKEIKALEFAVTDTGIGIPKESLEKIFDKFYQVESQTISRKGQGLGLAFCRLAVEGHGGKIWAESEEGKGSRFVVRVPIS